MDGCGKIIIFAANLGKMENGKYDENYRQRRIGQWKTAIGLQAVDGIQPSDYLYELAGRHIEGELNIREVQQFLNSYYESELPLS